MHSCSNNRAVINYDEPCIETSFFLLPLKDGVHTHTRFWRHWQWGEHAVGCGGARRGCGAAGQDDAARGSAGVGAGSSAASRTKRLQIRARRKGMTRTPGSMRACGSVRVCVGYARACAQHVCMREGKEQFVQQARACVCGTVCHCQPKTFGGTSSPYLRSRCCRQSRRLGLAASPRRPRGRPSASRCCSGCLVG